LILTEKETMLAINHVTKYY